MRQHRILLAMATVRPGHGHGTSRPPLARVCSRAYADRVLRRRVYRWLSTAVAGLQLG